MHYQSVWTSTVLLVLIDIISSHEARNKRGSEDVFNVLLNLYKIQPLKSSKVYKVFADHVLLPNRLEDSTINLNSNESKEKRQKAKLSIREIEKLMQTNTSTKNQKIEKPHYDVENVASEKFLVDIQFNDAMKRDKVKSHKDKYKSIERYDDDKFISMLDHLESSENYNEFKTTKSVPIDITVANINITPARKSFIVNPVYPDNAIQMNAINYYNNADVIVI